MPLVVPPVAAALRGVWAGAALVAFTVGLPVDRMLLAAQSVPSQEEVLAAAYPAATTIERHTEFIDDDMRATIAERALVEADDLPSVLTYYVALDGTRPLGFAYFDAHTVRTHREVLLILVRPDGALRRIEVFRFAEPTEYRPPARWLKLFESRANPREVTTRRAIPMITGATLTARAVTSAARRILELHRSVVAPRYREASPPVSSGREGGG